jgi:hypothetical protein
MYIDVLREYIEGCLQMYKSEMLFKKRLLNNFEQDASGSSSLWIEERFVDDEWIDQIKGSLMAK